MSLFGILTRTVLGLAPGPAATQPPALATSGPLMAAPTAQAAATPAAPATLTAAGVVDRIQQFYATIKQVTAQFRQTVTYETYGNSKASDGTVWIMKPGKMRWDYLDRKKPAADKKAAVVEVKKTFISNGTTLYVIEHDNKQVTKKNLEKDLMPVAVSFLYGKGDLKAEFSPELDRSGKFGDSSDIVVKLTPKQPSAQYKNLYLVVSPKDFHVSQSVIIDASNNVNHFRFYAPDFETAIKPTLFEFDERTVKSYRISDADAARDGGAPTTMPGAMPAAPAAAPGKSPAAIAPPAATTRAPVPAAVAPPGKSPAAVAPTGKPPASAPAK
jgi:outer membrane lipoprotein carrier protein